MQKEEFKKKKFRILRFITKTRLLVVLFIVLFIGFNWYQINNLKPQRTYYTEQSASSFPIIYQIRNGKRINELRGFRDEKYMSLMNDQLTVLNDNRELDLIINKNNNDIKEIQYEIRSKTSKDLLERTVLYIPDTKENEVKITAQIQNLIEEKTTYDMILKCDIGDKSVYYFLNIINKKKSKIDDAINQVESFTEATFDKIKAREIVKYLETNPNVDQKQLYNVSIESNFEQLTWGDTKMIRESEYNYNIYQAQDYCYNINVKYLASCENANKGKEFYNVKDEYVLRWDGKRFYIMKFDRTTEEYLNIDNDIYDKDKRKLNLGITNISNFEKKESENKNFVVFSKNNELYLYNVNNFSLKNIYGYHIVDNDSYMLNAIDEDTKILEVRDDGNVKFLVYGYNRNGANEGLIGLSVFEYNPIEQNTAQIIFVPIYTTFENLKYDLNKICLYQNDNLYFKSLDKIYGIDVTTGSIMTLVENIIDTTSEGSTNDLHFAYNEDGENYEKVITLLNMTNMTRDYIEAKDNEKIQVITFMNDDLFYGIATEDNEWIEYGKTIGYPFKKIVAINAITKEQKVFEQEGEYFYNFVKRNNALHYNKYTKQNNHYIRHGNDVIINNYVEQVENLVNIHEQMTKEKLKTAYLDINTDKNDLIKEAQAKINVKNTENAMLETEYKQQKDTYYVYNNGVLRTKTDVLSDGIGAIRDTYGYVKMNDKITCYNRSNKGNFSYLRINDSILSNLEYFEENICLIDNKILVMNLTGVECRDLEYYISLGEKVACYKNDTLQFFVTGYDNNDYILEYTDKERIRTPRAQLVKYIEEEGYISFAQLTHLE